MTVLILLRNNLRRHFFPAKRGRKNLCKTVARVCTPFTEGRYYGKGEKPNTELADNSTFTYMRTMQFMI